jgi:phenazine biosynthesis protein phzE
VTGLLTRVLSSAPPPFALLHRPEWTGRHRLDVLSGEVCLPDTLAGLPEDEVLAVVPYRQLGERGLACVDDGAPLIALRVTEHAVLPLHDVLWQLPEVPVRLVDGHFDTDYDLDAARTVFRRLCEQESGAYWTFLIHTGTRTFVGATPERHVSLHEGDVVMNPVSGTYRYPEDGPSLAGLLDFLDSHKESDELHMVLDEELKMMASVCEGGGRVVGPRLKEMARLAHTEYLITGRSGMSPVDILSETMFAPTVTGSPLASACRVITRYEPAGRGYYGGVAALIGPDRLDSAILIRTAELDPVGRVGIGVGATLVRHSDPAAEAAETRAKAATLLRVMSTDPSPLGEHPDVRAALDSRRRGLAEFWRAGGHEPAPVPARRRALVVDAEDTFTAMIAAQLRSLGIAVTVRSWDEPYWWGAEDLVVLGPGPGDPTDAGDPRNAHLRWATETLLSQGKPFLAVCLSHQVLSLVLGLDVRRGAVPHQGTQREIELFGENETVGFYNTFAAHSDADKLDVPGAGLVEISRDTGTGEVHALRGPHFAAMQFHAESVLTHNGPAILAARIDEILQGERP